MNKTPYTRSSKTLNRKIAFVIGTFNVLSKLSKKLGLPIKLYSDSKETLCLYYHDDHPDMILVDKSI